MKIEFGLFDHMVLQRNRKNVSEADFSGACATSGPVLATIRRGKGVVKGFASIPVGKAVRGLMKGCLKGLPAGGAYTIELQVGNEKLVVRDVLVGDVWLLGGQSNMHGYGLFPKKRLSADPRCAPSLWMTAGPWQRIPSTTCGPAWTRYTLTCAAGSGLAGVRRIWAPVQAPPSASRCAAVPVCRKA